MATARAGRCALHVLEDLQTPVRRTVGDNGSRIACSGHLCRLDQGETPGTPPDLAIRRRRCRRVAVGRRSGGAAGLRVPAHEPDVRPPFGASASSTTRKTSRRRCRRSVAFRLRGRRRCRRRVPARDRASIRARPRPCPWARRLDGDRVPLPQLLVGVVRVDPVPEAVVAAPAVVGRAPGSAAGSGCSLRPPPRLGGTLRSGVRIGRRPDDPEVEHRFEEVREGAGALRDRVLLLAQRPAHQRLGDERAAENRRQRGTLIPAPLPYLGSRVGPLAADSRPRRRGYELFTPA